MGDLVELEASPVQRIVGNVVADLQPHPVPGILGNVVADLQAYPILGSLEDGREFPAGKRLRPALWSELPEYVLERVLLFLPTRSICRLRLVCKRWRHLLGSGKFFQDKAALAPSAPLIFTLGHPDRKHKDGPPQHCFPVGTLHPYRWDLSFITQRFLDSIPPEDMWARRCGQVWCMDERVDCVDGLLCISRKRRRGFPEPRNLVVVNPVTRTYRALPTVPSGFFMGGVSAARLELDEPFGETFTLTWHMQESSSRRKIWAVGTYSSTSNTWKICKDSVDSTWEGDDSEVCDNYFINLVSNGRDCYNCVLHRFDTGKFVRTGSQAPIPRDDEQGKEWSLLHHAGHMYLIAVVEARREMRLGLEIWKLDISTLSYVRVAVAPTAMMEKLLPWRWRDSFCPLRAMSSIGDYICLRLSAISETGRTTHKDGKLWHVLACNVRQQSWHLLYEESDDEEALTALLPGQSYENRTAVPTYPFMSPNFHVFL